MRNPLTTWRRSPFTDILGFQRDFDRLFSDNEWPREYTDLAKTWNPKSAVTEDAEAYHVKVDLPGVPKEAVKVDFNEGVLTVSGERKDEKRDEKEHYSEVFYGSFMRTFTFPQNVDSERVGARFDNGVLVIDLAKTSKTSTRQIQVR